MDVLSRHQIIKKKKFVEKLLNLWPFFKKKYRLWPGKIKNCGVYYIIISFITYTSHKYVNYF